MYKMNKIKIMIVMLAASFCFSLPAQQGTQVTVSGTVIVASTGETLPGVNVIVRGMMTLSTTDLNGNFRITVNTGNVLMFQFVGFKTFEYVVTQTISDLKVSMEEETEQIEEVVITGVGAQRRVSLLASVSSVDVSELQTPAPSITNLLAGRISGVFTMQASGEPGKNLAEFWIRGRSTFGANDGALVLIDGMEGDINTIDPADIESFSVLKDASATAIYGSRGANGVIIVTTKRGESGKLSINARANVTLSQLRRLPNYLRAYEYSELANEARILRGEDILYNDIEMKVMKDGLDPDFYPDISWQDEIVRPLSWRQSYYVSGRGGGDIARYFVSLNTTTESAAYRVEEDNPFASNAGYNTYSMRINLDINLTKTTLLRFNSDAFISINQRPGLIGSTDYIWQSQAMITPVQYPIRYSNGQFPAIATSGDAGISPYVVINHMGNTKLQGFNSKFALTLEQNLDAITKGLKLTVLGSYDRNGNYNEQRVRIPDMYQAQQRSNRGELITVVSMRGSGQEYYNLYDSWHFRRWLLESTLTYDRAFGAHRYNALAKIYLDDTFASNQMGWDEMAGLTPAYSQIPKRSVRYTGRVGYGYRDTYMIDFNFGYTGSENFQPGRQFGFFPSIALGWIPSAYDWVKDNASWIDMLKVRASIGTVGNSNIGGRRFPYIDRVTQATTGVFGSVAKDIIHVSMVGANNLEWERAIKSNIGVDLRLLKNSVELTLDYFHDKREGIFEERRQVPDYAGLTNNAWGNTGNMITYGTDGNIAYNFEINKDMSATVRGNYVFYRNKIIHREQITPNYAYRNANDLPMNVTMGYRSLGFFKNQQDIDASPRQTFGGSIMPGDLKYMDINGDGVIDSEDQTPISYNSMNPLLNYGFGGQFNYKAFSIGILFQGVGNQYYYRNSIGYVPLAGNTTGNILEQYKDPSTRWMPRWYCEQQGIDMKYAENPNALLPRLSYGGNPNNMQTSDFWKANARYLRLREITFNYTLKNDFLRRIQISSIDLQLVGNNLHVWDKVKNFDPEQAHKNGMVYPIPSTYSFQMYINL